jgi:hypothetical protein
MGMRHSNFSPVLPPPRNSLKNDWGRSPQVNANTTTYSAVPSPRQHSARHSRATWRSAVDNAQREVSSAPTGPTAGSAGLDNGWTNSRQCGVGQRVGQQQAVRGWTTGGPTAGSAGLDNGWTNSRQCGVGQRVDQQPSSFPDKSRPHTHSYRLCLEQNVNGFRLVPGIYLKNQSATQVSLNKKTVNFQVLTETVKNRACWDTTHGAVRHEAVCLSVTFSCSTTQLQSYRNVPYIPASHWEVTEFSWNFPVKSL